MNKKLIRNIFRGFISLILFCYFDLSDHTANAQEVFVGVVQHAQGNPRFLKRNDNNPKQEITFKTLIYPGDQIGFPKDSRLKIITSKRCIGVIYAQDSFWNSDAKIVAPSSNTNLWIVQNAPARWICPSGSSQNLNLDGVVIELENAEILYSDRTLLVRKGKVKSLGKILKAQTTYELENKKWKVKFSKNDFFFSWHLNQELPQPVESLKRKTKPVRNISSRWVLGFNPGPIAGTAHSNAKYDISDPEFHGDGPVVLANFKVGNFSVLGRFEATEIKTSDSGRDPSNSKGFDNYNRVKSYFANVGLRFNHLRSWSYYALLGLGSQEYSIDGDFEMGPTGHQYVSRDEQYTSLKLAFGIDKVFFQNTKKWYALFSSVEIFATQSLSHTGTKVRENNCPTGDLNCVENFSPEGVKDGFNTFGLQVTLGPMLQF